MSTKRYSESTRAKILRLYSDGKSMSEISRMAGMPTQKTVRKILVELGAHMRGNPRVYDRDLVLRDLKSGMTMSQVTQKHGCSARWVFKMKKENR